MADKLRIPEKPEYFHYDYQHDLALARMSQMAFANQSEMNAALTSSFQEQERRLPLNWSPDNKFRFKREDDTGFDAWVFRESGTRNLVVAFRGNDEYKDWMGPTLQTVADGPILNNVIEMINPLGTGLKGQAEELAIKAQKGFFKNWDPQFDQALDLVRDVRKAYPDHHIQVTGAGTGGALAQVAAHTFGMPGRSFDAPGAANIVESQGYTDWLGRNNMPRIPPEESKDTAKKGRHDHGAFINYKINNSPLSNSTGPHLGDYDTLSSLSGKETLTDRLKQGGRAALGGVATALPAVGKIVRIEKEFDWMVTYGQVLTTGKDLSEVGGADRSVAVLEATLERGKLQRWGQHEQEPDPAQAKQTPAAPKHEPGSIEDLFERATNAALLGDAKGLKDVAQEYKQSSHWIEGLQAGREYNNQQAQLAAQQVAQEAERRAQQQATEQQAAPVYSLVRRM